MNLISQALQAFWGDAVPLETDRRVFQYWQEFTSPDFDVSTLFKKFEADYDEIVVVKDIPFQSLCEHHLLPFFGVAHIAYIPVDYVLGLSKFGRVVDYYAKRPQLQERVTQQVGAAIDEHLEPSGTLVIMEGTHTCMSARGVLKQGAITKTSFCSGLFRVDRTARQEALQLIYG
jgi:GTP cyclohydrolase I